MVRIRRLFRPRSARSALLLLSLLSVIGCGGNRFAVVGKVTVGGQPVTGGTVVFTDIYTNTTYAGTIDSDGSYKVTAMPQSDFVVSLFNPAAPLPGQIPARYASTSNGLPQVETNIYGDVVSGDDGKAYDVVTDNIDLQP
jgi:hypothetical protein